MNMVSRKAVSLAIKYLSEDPMNKLPKLFSLAEALDRGHQRTADIRRIRGFLEDENNNWHIYAKKLSEEVDPHCLRKVMECFFVNSMLDGIPRGREIEQKYDINVPWVILLDPTSACNLSCVGCWAAEYGHKFNLSYEILDSIVRQGKS